MSDALATMQINHALQHAQARADLTDRPDIRAQWLAVAQHLRQAANYAAMPGYRGQQNAD